MRKNPSARSAGALIPARSDPSEAKKSATYTQVRPMNTPPTG